ncbi:hypothetical protein [Nocardiopsis sp. RV163]|uniref:hypothetical protein n=1 Tax=Nocardiopsis sp. RV163 TaxID=1661388 RepID=UPI00064C097D|nr:hypothetical protein [Nocardiopsis sp. RV163]
MIAAAVLLTLFLTGTLIALYAETRRISVHRGGDWTSGRAGLWRAAVLFARYPRSCARFWWGFLAGACVILYASEGSPASAAAGLVCLGVWGPPGPLDGRPLRYPGGRRPRARFGPGAPATLYRRRVRFPGVAAVLVMVVLSAVLVFGAGGRSWYAAVVALLLPVLGLVVWQRTVYPEVRLSGTRLLLKRYAVWVSIPVEWVARVDAGDGVAVHFLDGRAFYSRAWGSAPARDEEVAREIDRFVREARERVPASADRPLGWGRDLVAGPFAVWLGLVLAWMPVGP